MFFFIKKTPGGKGKSKKPAKRPAKPKVIDCSLTRRELDSVGIKGRAAESVIEDAVWSEKRVPGSGEKTLFKRVSIEHGIAYKDEEIRKRAFRGYFTLGIQGTIPFKNVFKRVTELHQSKPELRHFITDALALSHNDAIKAGNREYAKKALELLRKLTGKK